MEIGDQDGDWRLGSLLEDTLRLGLTEEWDQLCELESQISSPRWPRLGYFGARKPGLTHGNTSFWGWWAHLHWLALS